jgi:hypothetical protein
MIIIALLWTEYRLSGAVAFVLYCCSGKYYGHTTVLKGNVSRGVTRGGTFIPNSICKGTYLLI